MDDRGFADLCRTLAAGLTRRRLLGALAGVVLGGTFGRGRAAAQACPSDQVARRGLGCVCKANGRPPDPTIGFCPCPNGQTRCRVPSGWVCVDTKRDVANCGACGTVCLPGSNVATVSCRNATCRIEVCLPGYATCDGVVATGCETPLGTNAACGRCGDACLGPGQTCGGGGVAGVCGCTDDGTACAGKTCGAALTNCGQSVYCGPSNGACPVGQECLGGQCACTSTSCPDGCCDETGTCRVDDDLACGIGGGACAGCNGYGVTCGGGAQVGVCGCTDDGHACTGKVCGTALTTCGEDVLCGPLDGACPESKECVGNQCACTATSCLTGCCDETGSCRVDDDLACGTAGGACVTCSGVGVTCGGGGLTGICGCIDDGTACLSKTCGTAVTNCGQSVVCGPVCQATFDTVGQHAWTVPAGTTRVQIEAYGASGGSGGGNDIGLGGYAQATVTVSPGQVLNVFVGGTGADGTVNDREIGFGGDGGFNGGGDGGNGLGIGGGGGGGASDVRLGGTSRADRIVVAGGGGGQGGNNWGVGGGGGGESGSAGEGIVFINGHGSLLGGMEGTATAGGAGGVFTEIKRGGDGGLGVGGAGADTPLFPPPCFAGGGGGGGLYGGGGGAFSTVAGGGGGGGGSGFISGDADLNVDGATFEIGVRLGNGLVVITQL